MNKVLLSAKDIKARVQELARQINKDYDGVTPVFMCILKGAFMFLADLLRYIDVPCDVEFISAASYKGTHTTGNVIISDIPSKIFERDVIIVEDIIDTGLTLDNIIKALRIHGPSSIAVCALLDKKERRIRDIPTDKIYTGFEIPNKFVVGYGLDYNDRFRGLKDVCIHSD